MYGRCQAKGGFPFAWRHRHASITTLHFCPLSLMLHHPDEALSALPTHHAHSPLTTAEHRQ